MAGGDRGRWVIRTPIAWLTARTDLPGRRAWAVLTAVPLALPSYVVGFAFLAFFGPRGTLQGVLAPLGVERLPSIAGFGAAALVLTLVSFPYVALATRAGLLRLDPALEESARLLGDGRYTDLGTNLAYWADRYEKILAEPLERKRWRDGSDFPAAQERYRAGLGNYLVVLSTESQVLAQRRLAVDLRARQLDTRLVLMKALGGGWTDDTAVLHTAAAH